MNPTIKAFETRLSEITEQQIINLSKTDNTIFNVVQGFHKNSFSTVLWDDTRPEFDYFLIFVTRNIAKKLEGFILKMQPGIKIRNELITCFTSFICKRYDIKDYHSIFNTYQDQQRTLFERLDYWTYDDNILDELKDKNATVILKQTRGAVYIPFAIKPVDESLTPGTKRTGKNIRSNSKDSHHYVYLMLNKRNSYHKIGRSINPEHREKTLQAEEPEIILVNKWLASAETEKALHKKFKEKRKKKKEKEVNGLI